MLERIIRFSIKNPFLVFLFTAVLIFGGVYGLRSTPIDAIPDLSDVQVIVFTEYPGQAPRIVEDQVTYPITTKMLSVPAARVVRGYSFFGFSFVYVIFEDGTDMYWARSRVLEYMNQVQGQLPEGVNPTLGPDATGVGWAYMYVVTSEKRDLQELRSIQDWNVRYALASVEGVAEVAGIGGFVKQYQVVVDPDRLRAYGLTLADLRMAVERGSGETGGRVIEIAEREHMVRAKGYVQSVDELGAIAVRVDERGTPILLRDVARVQLGPDMRRGLADLDGEGEVVGGIVVVRYGADTREVIDKVKAKLKELERSLPDDVKIKAVYDRSDLIDRAVRTLQSSLVQQALIVAVVCVVFLLHLRSALVIVIVLPVAVLGSFFVMSVQGIGANIMSLGGIAIAIDAMVDAVITMVENAHKRIERDGEDRPRWDVIRDAAVEVGPTLFYSLLVITVSFLPVFALQGQEGRLFKPLAYTKTYSMAAAALLSITLAPVLMGYLIRGRIRPEEKNPVNRALMRVYNPVVERVLARPWLVIGVAGVVVALTVIPFLRLGSEFMPPLREGTLMYMPSTLPSMSVTKAKEVLQQTDRIIKQIPEVQSVFGKAGRADTPTDPAPIEMFETVIVLKPESEWREGMTEERIIEELDRAIKFPGLVNAWTMPIKARIDMLSTGIKTPVGVKVSGPDLEQVDRIARAIEGALGQLEGTASVYAERVTGGEYVTIDIDRAAIARYGIALKDVHDVVETALGGMELARTVEGLERYTIIARYEREFRESPARIREILVGAPTGVQVPLGQLARVTLERGPPAIKSEDAQPTAWIFVDLRSGDIGSYVERAQQAIEGAAEVPEGYRVEVSGQYEYMQRARRRLLIVVPVTLVIVFVIIYMNTSSLVKTAIVLLAVPFSLVGALWLLYLAGYNLSVAVWVGIIALAGLAAETGVIMLLFLDLAYEDAKRRGRLRNLADLRAAIREGAVTRVRPIVMTAAMVVGLAPILWSQGAGADVMKRIALPVIGGVVTAMLMELLVFPAIFYVWRRRSIGDSTPPDAPTGGASEPPQQPSGTPDTHEASRSRDPITPEERFS